MLSATSGERRFGALRIFLSTEPQAAIDIAVVWFSGAQIAKFDGEQEAQKRRVIGSQPLMHADEVLRRGANAGLFPQFTFGGLQQRFIGLEMARRLVPQRFAVNGFFDDEKFIPA